MDKYSSWILKCFRQVASRGAGPPNVNLGPHIISETFRARKLKLKTQLDMDKYSFQR